MIGRPFAGITRREWLTAARDLALAVTFALLVIGSWWLGALAVLQGGW